MRRMGIRRGLLTALLGVVTLSTGVGLGAATVVGLAAVGTARTAGAVTEQTSGENNSSYAIVDAAGGVMTFGGAGFEGDTLALSLQKPIVGSAADPNGGYWLVASDGGIFTFGGTQFYGSTGGTVLNKPIVGMAPTPDGKGYWLVASDGGIFTFGDAQFYGSTGAIVLNKPIVGMAPTPDGKGYWLVASDGGIFTFGDAQFYGSTGGIKLNKPIVGMAATANGMGYWMVATDGGIFTFGNANFFGSTGALTLNSPIVGMTPTPDGGGYWLVGADAGVFTFGNAQFAGSAESPLHPPLFPADFSQPIAPAVAIMPDTPGPQAAHDGQLRVAFVGDSLGLYEGQYTMSDNQPYLIDNGSAPGCGFTNGAPLLPWNDPGSVYQSPGACTYWAQQVEWVTARFHPDVTVIQVGYWESQNRLFNGSYTTLDNPAYANYIQANLQQAVNIAHGDGGAVLLATSPYFNDGTPNHLVDIFNNIVKNIIGANSFVSLFDVNNLLDPNGGYDPVVNGVLVRTADGVHLTQAGVQLILDPPLTNLVQSVGNAVFNDKSL